MMKKTILAATALFLSACGFQPMHSASTLPDSPSLKNVKVELIEPELVNQREAGYYLQQHLFDRLGQNDGPHILKVSPTARRRPYGLTSNDVASRFDYILTVEYELVNSGNGKTMNKGKISATTTFGSSRDPYARISSEKSAADQVARDAADRIIVRLASFYNNPERFKRREEEKLRRRLEEQANDVETLPETP